MGCEDFPIPTGIQKKGECTTQKIPYKHRATTQAALIASAGCGPLGAFFGAFDVAAIAGIWGTCLFAIAHDEGRNLNKNTAIDICKAALLGMGGYYAGCKLATKAFLLIPFAGIFTAMGASAVTNILFTYRFALTLCTIFAEQGRSLDFSNLADNIKAMFKGNGLVSDARDIVDIWLHG